MRKFKDQCYTCAYHTFKGTNNDGGLCRIDQADDKRLVGETKKECKDFKEKDEKK